MPRRNYNARRRTRGRPVWTPATEPPTPTFEELARRLVRTGACSPLILESAFIPPTTERNDQ